MAERIAVIGTGAMGTNHARTVQGLHRHAELSYIVDADISRAEAVAAQYGDSSTELASSIDDLHQGNTDGAIIAVPSHLHAEMAIDLMNRGIPVLVEKPLALTVEEAEQMADVAAQNDTVLMAGHVELFNPVVRELRKLVGDRALRSVRFERLGFVDNPRRLYHDVVSDLMLHDISIANQLVDSDNSLDPVPIASFGRKDGFDFANSAEAIVDYMNGTNVHLRASRSFRGGKVRRVEVEAEDGVYDADLISREITKRTAGEGAIATSGTFVQDVRTSSFFAQDGRQPLELELLHFLASIKGQTTPEAAHASAEEAKRILKMTNAILDMMVMIRE